MMGRLNQDQGQLFYSFCLADAVPDDHPIRGIAAVLDLKWVYAELAPHYPRLGRPSVDPVLMLRMLLIGYLFAIRSERALCREVKRFYGTEVQSPGRRLFNAWDIAACRLAHAVVGATGVLRSPCTRVCGVLLSRMANRFQPSKNRQETGAACGNFPAPIAMQIWSWARRLFRRASTAVFVSGSKRHRIE